MKHWKSQAHVKWESRYHVVVLPKNCPKTIYGILRQEVGETPCDRCRRRSIELEEGNAMPVQIHMLLSIQPKYSIAMPVSYLKGKSAIRIHRQLLKT